VSGIYFFEADTWITVDQNIVAVTNTGPVNVKVENDFGLVERNGIIITALAGVEYKVSEGLGLLGKVNYIKVFEGKRKYETPLLDGNTGQLIGTEWTGWRDKNDALVISDVIVGVRYMVMPNIFIQAYGNYPVYSSYETDDVPDRNYGLHLGVDSIF